MIYSAPLMLTSYTDVLPGNSGMMNSDKLRSPSGDAFEVLGFRFNAEHLGGVILGRVCSSIKIQIKIGNLDLTKGFVPIWLLNNPCSYLQDVGVSYRNNGDDGLTSFSHRLRLEKTFIVGPGDAFVIEVERETGDALSLEDDTIPIRVWGTVIGRYFKPGTARTRRMNNVPLIIPWIGDAIEDQFSIHALKNPLLKPLWIERIVGRIEYRRDGFDIPEDVIGPVPVMDMVDSMGYRMVRQNTPFNNVFIPGSRDWVFHRNLDPNGYFTVHTRMNGLQNARPMLAMIGYRREEM